MTIKLVSADLNGTLVREHTMSDMLRIYKPGSYKQAKEVFDAQTAGEATIEEAFAIAGPLTEGLTLRQAIDYAQNHMTPVDGLSEFTHTLRRNGTHLVINSTGYFVTVCALMHQYPVTGQISNQLIFTDGKSELSDLELSSLVAHYKQEHKEYDNYFATGEVRLEVSNEARKPLLAVRYRDEYFPHIQDHEIAHIGDSMGDSIAIERIAQLGGKGIAFNYNNPLADYLTTRSSDRIYLVDPKSKTADLRHTLSIITN